MGPGVFLTDELCYCYSYTCNYNNNNNKKNLLMLSRSRSEVFKSVGNKTFDNYIEMRHHYSLPPQIQWSIEW